MLISPVATFEGAIPFPTVMETRPFAELIATRETLAEVDLLVVPLIGDGFDALDVIEQLGMTMFTGHVRVVCKRLASRDMVLGELRALATPLGLTVDLSESL